MPDHSPALTLDTRDRMVPAELEMEHRYSWRGNHVQLLSLITGQIMDTLASIPLVGEYQGSNSMENGLHEETVSTSIHSNISLKNPTGSISMLESEIMQVREREVWTQFLRVETWLQVLGRKWRENDGSIIQHVSQAWDCHHRLKPGESGQM